MAANGDTKELRLALVCYGGSSLAIYMHGVTKEIHRLVKGSSLLESGAPDSGTPSEQVYAQLLRELEKREHGVRTRVIVDIVAGTSAGGINGICLAKALAHNLSLDRLRDLWFKRGDINGLINISPLPFKLDRLVPKKLRAPLKLARLAVKAPGREPLRGKEMCQWIHDAFSGMESERPQPPAPVTLVAPGHRLQLFVTITDFFGYDRQVPNTDPNPIHDRRHRHALQFRYGNGEDDFGDDAGLTLAARTTSCIPGVFPPVSLQKLAEWIGPERVDTEALRNRYFRLYELADEPPEHTWFVDGGVLDNKPFGWAVDAIRDQQARHEVKRRLVYVEPDPHVARGKQEPDAPEPEPRAPPNTFAAIIGGLSGLPRSEPILDDLLVVTELNERAERILDIVESSEAEVMRSVAGITGDLTEVPEDPADPKLALMRATIENAARDSAGLGYATYIRVKMSQVVDRYATTACAVCDLPPDSNHALLVREAIRQWARNTGLFEQAPLPTQRQLDFLVAFDLDYGERRLRFVIDCLRGWYEHADQEHGEYPSRKDIDAAKQRLYAAIETLHTAMDGREFDKTLRQNYDACFVASTMREYMQTTGFDVSEYVSDARYGPALADLETSLRAYVNKRLEAFTSALYTEMLQLAHQWPKVRQAELLLRYLGFPFWDVMLFPVQALGQVGEHDKIEIFRISPLDATGIPPLDPNPLKPKLGGAEFHHFGAFFHADARQRDYLWGRLDGAERLLDIVLEHESDDVRTVWSHRLFAAILEEDATTVPLATDLVDRVRETLAVGAS